MATGAVISGATRGRGGAALGRHLAGKAEKVLHDLFGALRLLKDYSQIAARAFGQFGIFHQQVGESEDSGKRIVDLVGDAGDQISDGGHFLRVDQLGAQHGRVGDVGHDHDYAAHPALIAADGTEIDGELGAHAVATNQGHIKIVDLLAPGNFGLRFAQSRAARRSA